MDDYSKKVKHIECLNVYQIKNANLLEVKMHEFVCAGGLGTESHIFSGHSLSS